MMIWTPIALSALLSAPTTRVEKLTRVLILEESRASGAGEIARYLSDPDSGLRYRAALAAGRIGDRELVESLFDLLNDRRAEMRRMAAFALGILGERAAAPRLAMALQDADPAVRGRAAEALARLGDRSRASDVARMIVTALPERASMVTVRGDDPGNPNDPWLELRLGLFALARLGDAAAAADVLVKDGQSRFDWWAATYLASRIASPPLKPALLSAARSSDPLSRMFAARGLLALADPSTLGQIEELTADRDPLVAIQALRALSGVPGSRAVLIAESALLSSEPGIIEAALLALGQMSIPSGMLPQVVGFIGHSDPGIRAAALRALAQADREQLALVLSGLDPDPVWSVRAALAETLGEIGDGMSQGILQTMLSEPDSRVLPVVLGALARAQGQDARKTLRRYSDHADFAVRACAVQWLAQHGDQSDADVLLAAYERALSDTEPDARLAALAAVATRCGEAGEGVLLRAARDDLSPVVRAQATRMLSEKGRSVAAAASVPISPHLDYRLNMAPFAPLPDMTVYTPRALIHTRRGTIEVHLNVIEAPLSCSAFIRLARRGFYNDLVFDTVVPGEIVYGGCPRGDGRGNAGFMLPSEPGLRPFGRGAVGLAAARHDTGSSRFFITLAPMPERDGGDTLIGWVVNGIETVAHLRPNDSIDWIEIWDGR